MYKDTVMTGEDMSQEIQTKAKKWSIVNPEFIEDIGNIIANKQAEISFKAGIREVVEWIEDWNLWDSLSNDIHREWQAKLKEWGIK